MSAVRPLVALAALALLAGCNETVGFLHVELEVPTRDPALTCARDPRRAKTVTFDVSCDGGRVQVSYAAVEGTVGLSEVPLGSCTITVQALNAGGRVVLSGKTLTTITRGENTAVKITLLEQRCSDSSCDADGDKLADVDERALGTDPQRSDTDGDGLEDGLEVQQCCSDPLVPNKDCKLLIQRVEPGLGPVGESVMIKASTPLTAPTAELGGRPLEDPLADSTVVFGKVAPGATLGEARLTSGGTTDTYQNLFAVLREDPESLSDLDQRAGAKVGLMQELADVVVADNLLFVLGATGASAGGTPVVLVADRAKNVFFRVPVPVKGTPIALGVGEQRGVVLLRESGGLALLVVYDGGFISPAPVTPRIIKGVANQVPVALAVEASGQVAQVLYEGALQRVALAANGGSAVVTLDAFLGVPPKDPAAPPPPPGGSLAACAGILYREGKTPGAGATALTCNLPLGPCPPNASCDDAAQLLLVSPVEKCLPVDGKPVPSVVTGGCWARHVSKGFGRALGAPVVDEAAQRVYVASSSGLLAASIKGGLSSGVLVPWFGRLWQSKPSSTRLMALDPRGALYVVDGQLVWRLEPRLDGPQRGGRPFVAGRYGEQATMLALSQDGTLLEVGRRREGVLSSLASVCLDRCAECLCSK